MLNLSVHLRNFIGELILRFYGLIFLLMWQLEKVANAIKGKNKADKNRGMFGPPGSPVMPPPGLLDPDQDSGVRTRRVNKGVSRKRFIWQICTVLVLLGRI